MRKRTTADVLIVGSGATGSMAAWKLTQRGFSTVLLDAGPPWRLRPQAGPYLKEAEFPYGFPKRHPYLWNRVRAVGGRMNVWTRASLRMSDRDFRAAEYDGCGNLWPIVYSDLEWHYDLAEKLLGVEGDRDGLSQIPDGSFLKPPIPIAMHHEFKRRVEHRWSGRNVVVSRMATHPIDLLREQALATGNLVIVPNTLALRIKTDDGGRRAVGVESLSAVNQEAHEYRARAVLLCASTIETTLLLMRSELGLTSGTLGRFLSDHTTVDCSGIIPFSRTVPEPIERYMMSYIPSFQGTRKGRGGFMRGYGIQCEWHPCARNSDPLGRCPFIGVSGPDPHAGHFFFRSCGEIIARQENHVRLSTKKQDVFGVRAAEISFRYGENELRMMEDQKRALGELARESGLAVVVPPHILPIGTACHELGTARMGEEPGSSVLNPLNQLWEVPNLYVLDGAAFVSAGFQNPTLTMMAIASRGCDIAAGELR